MHQYSYQETRPRGYKTWVHSHTQNKAQWLAACGHVSAAIIALYFESETVLKFYNLEAYKTFFMLNPNEHRISSAHKN